VQLKRAETEDAPAIAEVHVRARQAAYRHFFPPDYLDGLDPSGAADLWRTRLAQPGTICFLMEALGRVAGFIRFGPNEEQPQLLAEVFQLHVHPDFWRQTVGSSLLTAACTELAKAGFDAAILYVYEANERARRFYEHEGWRLEDRGPLAEYGGALIPQLRYGRRLS
jgi:ribosomal protein S18 acetylase RimI-like enzyme